MDDERPYCWDATCEAPRGETGVASCIHCGGELHQVGNFWYHWTSFDNNWNLIEGAQIQDIVTNQKEDKL